MRWEATRKNYSTKNRTNVAVRKPGLERWMQNTIYFTTYQLKRRQTGRESPRRTSLRLRCEKAELLSQRQRPLFAKWHASQQYTLSSQWGRKIFIKTTYGRSICSPELKTLKSFILPSYNSVQASSSLPTYSLPVTRLMGLEPGELITGILQYVWRLNF